MGFSLLVQPSVYVCLCIFVEPSMFLCNLVCAFVSLVCEYVCTSFEVDKWSIMILEQEVENQVSSKVKIKIFPSRAYPRAPIRAHQILSLQCALEPLQGALGCFGDGRDHPSHLGSLADFQYTLGQDINFVYLVALERCTRNALGHILIWTNIKVKRIIGTLKEFISCT